MATRALELDLTCDTQHRQYFKSVINDIQLHVFCDSSMAASGAVAYLRISTLEGPICKFLIYI